MKSVKEGFRFVYRKGKLWGSVYFVSRQCPVSFQVISRRHICCSRFLSQNDGFAGGFIETVNDAVFSDQRYLASYSRKLIAFVPSNLCPLPLLPPTDRVLFF